jgi:hypothetical protein
MYMNDVDRQQTCGSMPNTSSNVGPCELPINHGGDVHAHGEYAWQTVGHLVCIPVPRKWLLAE